MSNTTTEMQSDKPKMWEIEPIQNQQPGFSTNKEQEQKWTGVLKTKRHINQTQCMDLVWILIGINQ